MIKPTSNFKVTTNKFVKFATNMTKSGVYLPIILLEGTVVAGRTYQAYKRGGLTEARERFIEETTGSFVWLGGAPLLTKLGNFIGKKFAGIKNTDFDIGKDAVRNPLEHVVKNTKGATMKRYSNFKFTNTILSIVLASGFLGFVVPKINQKITELTHNASKKQEQKVQPTVDNFQRTSQIQEKEQQNEQSKIAKQKAIKENKSNFKNIDSFVDSTKKDKNVAFKGLSPEQIATITHNLEHNAVYKLLSTDSGVLAGRTLNARNADESREIFFRDAASIFFYLFAQNAIIKGLTALDNKSLKGNVNIDPFSAAKIHNYLIDNLQKEKMSVDEFAKFALGDFDKTSFDKLKFDKNKIITLDDFKKAISNKALQERATKMSTLQPLKNGVSILTEKQVQDVLTSGKINDPELLKDVLNSIFGKLDGKQDVLTDTNKFIPRKEIEASIEDIKAYAQSIVEYAKKHNINEITPETMLKVNKRNLHRRIGFVAAGFLTAAAFLSTIIPKVQYYITKVKTGSDSFPGAREFEEKTQKEAA
ncbi:hypothetical protein J6Q66_05070 [bacterium]|nr:hypothetical protein [bacterium]